MLEDWQVPIDPYYGVHTSRVLENFQITGTAVHSFLDLIYALVSVKQAPASMSTHRVIGGSALPPIPGGAQEQRTR
ncbi:MAG: aspartate ammonia-lyase [Halieaceae bacterium]